MSNSRSYAERELRIAGLYDPDSDYDGALPESVLELLDVFARQGHSGAGAARVASLFSRLVRFEPLSPLTGDADEWEEVDDGLWQNRRCARVFKTKDGAYDAEGRVFGEPSGASYVCGDSRVPVTFPYTPRTEIVDVGG